MSFWSKIHTNEIINGLGLKSQELETQGPHFSAEERIVYWKLRHLEKK